MNVRPEWPTTQPDADTLLRYIAGRGVWLSSALWTVMGREGDGRRSDKIMCQMISAHDVFLVLSALRGIDSARADELADRIWSSAEAGDSYGEWLWQWADEIGLDCEAISEDGTRLGEEPTTHKDRSEGDKR